MRERQRDREKHLDRVGWITKIRYGHMQELCGFVGQKFSVCRRRVIDKTFHDSVHNEQKMAQSATGENGTFLLGLCDSGLGLITSRS